jgi:hypothetical protein
MRHAKRIAIAIAATLVAINIWTGAPLLAVWVGSRVAPESGTSMGAIVLVLVVLAISVFGLAVALTHLNAAYDRLTGRVDTTRRVAPWLRSMRAERHTTERRRVATSAIERIVIGSVVIAVLALEVWFFFFAHYSIPGA